MRKRGNRAEVWGSIVYSNEVRFGKYACCSMSVNSIASSMRSSRNLRLLSWEKMEVMAFTIVGDSFLRDVGHYRCS